MNGEEILISKIQTKEELEDSPKTEFQLRKAYSRQCEELKFLRKQLTNRDRRIQDLEKLVASLQSQVSNLRIRTWKKSDWRPPEVGVKKSSIMQIYEKKPISFRIINSCFNVEVNFSLLSFS